jgi:hypothetical protein
MIVTGVNRYGMGFDRPTASPFVTFVIFCKKTFVGLTLESFVTFCEYPLLTNRDRMNPGTGGAGET